MRELVIEDPNERIRALLAETELRSAPMSTAALLSLAAALAVPFGGPRLIATRRGLCENCNKPRSAEANHCTRCGHWRRRV